MRIRNAAPLGAFALPTLAVLCLLGRSSAAEDRVSPWRDYQIIVWQPQTAAQIGTLKKIGVTGGEVHLWDIDRPEELPTADLEPLLANGLHWYVENIATDFYSAYHRWSGDRPVNWKFQDAKTLYLRDPSNLETLRRDPSLSDPAWLTRIRDRLARTVRAYAPYRPLFYDLADEAGLADLSIPWDFDFSDASLAEMRIWLAQRYPSLAALNAEWGTNFGSWDSVMPMTTREAIGRADGNFAPWADFKDWMDAAFARALRAGTDAIHRADPAALSGMEGAQLPGWGGYDYTRLAHAVDVMELYDGGGNLEVARSLNPTLIVLTTSYSSGAQERFQIWRELLRGSRGVILWDPDHQLAASDGQLGARGRDDAPLFHELHYGIAALLINSRRRFDPIAILYSPQSLRIQWMLDWKRRGQAWAERDIADSYEDENSARDVMMLYEGALERLGLHPRFVSPEGLTQGDLERRGVRLLILPHALAISAAEAAAVRTFIDQGGTVLADREPGQYDGHGKKLANPSLSDLFRSPARALIQAPPSAPGVGEVSCAAPDLAFSARLRRRGFDAAVQASDAAHGTRCDLDTYEFRNGAVRLLALQRRRPADNPATAKDDVVTITLPKAAYAYDVRRQRLLGHSRRVRTQIDAIEPMILALSPTRLPAPELTGPSNVRPGRTARFKIRFDGSEPAAVTILHVEIDDPSGASRESYARNLQASPRGTSFRVLLKLGDRPGPWMVRVTDCASGKSAQWKFRVIAPLD